MKKITHSLILVLLTYIGSTAQTFTGLVDGNKWIFYCEKSINPEMYDTDYYWTQEVKGDTIIDGCTYKKVYNTITGWENENSIDKPLASFFCQEDNKIYEWSNGERVLNYDFNLQAGEKFYTAYDIELIVDSVRYKNMPDNRSLKHLYVSMSEEQNLNDVWIEGVGSLTDGLNKSTIGSVGSGRKLVSFVSQGVELLNNASHEYIPYVREGNEWVILGRDGYKQFSIGQEVVIDNKSYYELNYAYFDPSKGCVTNRSLYDYIWEHDKKVYLGTDTQNRLLYDFGAQVLDTIRYDHLDESYYYYTVVNSVSSQEILGKQRLVMNVSHYCSVHDFYVPIQSSWIEGIGAINEDIFDFENSYRMGASATPDQFYYYTNSNESGCYPEVQGVIDFSAISTISINTSTLTLHRSGDVLMATFPTAGQGEAITLYDATGREVTTQPIREGATTASIDVATLPDGIYIARLSNGTTAKVVL